MAVQNHSIMNCSGYVLVTPVRDEEKTIGLTIASVVAQTLRPREWVIVSDGSTDRTNEIVSSASREHPWIRLLALPPRIGRDFAAVVKNTERGVLTLECRDYAFLGLLDADVSFQADYFEQLLKRFAADVRLGLAGGVVIGQRALKDGAEVLLHGGGIARQDGLQERGLAR